MTTHGVLSDTELKRAIKQGWIAADAAFLDDQIQPASLDMRLGETAYRLRASFLPGAGARVMDRLDDQVVMHQIDLRNGAVLETGCVYLVQVQEELALPQHIHGAANPKSSTGRVDVFTRVIADGVGARPLDGRDLGATQGSPANSSPRGTGEGAPLLAVRPPRNPATPSPRPVGGCRWWSSTPRSR